MSCWTLCKVVLYRGNNLHTHTVLLHLVSPQVKATLAPQDVSSKLVEKGQSTDSAKYTLHAYPPRASIVSVPCLCVYVYDVAEKPERKEGRSHRVVAVTLRLIQRHDIHMV